jgi:hypothetical protein
MGFGNRVRPLALSVLYHSCLTPDASPRAISGRTSYHQVRLAFHPYPQLIRDFFNNHRFGPPRDVTRASTWPWVAHLASGLLHTTQPLAGHALFRLAFAAAPRSSRLTSPHRVTRRFILQKARDQAERIIALSRFVSTRFQVLFTPLPGFFSRFPSRYLITIGREEVFSLG